MSMMHKMMFSVYHSELTFDETVAALRTSAQEHGWDIPMEHDLQETYQTAGYEDMTRVTTLYFCNPEGGYRILQHDEHKPMAVMMPMGVSVYETSDGEVYIAGMNLERMSLMFASPVKEVLREGAANYAAAVGDIATPEKGEEIEMDGGRCCLGCVALTAIGAALVGIIALVAIKMMPTIMSKMMAKMMPIMMERMEEAGVQPPCAQIILDRLDEQA